MNAELGKIVQIPKVKEQMLRRGVYALQPHTPAQAGERLKADVDKWARFINDAGIKSGN